MLSRRQDFSSLRSTSCDALNVILLLGIVSVWMSVEVRTHVAQAISVGIATPGMSASLGYFDQFRRENLPANLVQAQRDFFGSHTYQRNDGIDGWFHTVWSAGQSADSITTSSYNN